MPSIYSPPRPLHLEGGPLEQMITPKQRVQALLGSINTVKAGEAQAIVHELPEDDARFDTPIAGGHAAVGFWLKQPEGENGEPHTHSWHGPWDLTPDVGSLPVSGSPCMRHVELPSPPTGLE